MSLADELLADLEEGGEDVDEVNSDMEAEVDEIDDVALTTEKPSNSVRNVAKLQDSKEVHLTVVYLTLNSILLFIYFQSFHSDNFKLCHFSFTLIAVSVSNSITVLLY